MSMPNHLVFVRHGQSEANIVQHADKNGEIHELHNVVNDRPDWQQRLSRVGIEQAKIAGEWIARNLGSIASFDLRYHSMFLRTRETAAYLCGDDNESIWIPEDRLVERSWGHYGTLSSEERDKMFAMTSKMYKQSPWYVKLDGGESRFEVSDRWRLYQDTLHRDADGKKVLAVTHGDLIGIARYNIERMSPEQFEEMENDKAQTVKNCAVIHYSRVNPEDEGDVEEKLMWRRIVNPTDIDSSPFGGEWVKLPPRPRYTASDLLAQVEQAPRLIPDEMYEQEKI
jgi:broad specificity phosphatase PhoE